MAESWTYWKDPSTKLLFRLTGRSDGPTQVEGLHADGRWRPRARKPFIAHYTGDVVQITSAEMAAEVTRRRTT